MRSLIVCLLFIIPVALHGLYEGQSKEEVRAELGSPNGMRSLSGGEVWVYSGDITLEFAGDELVRTKGLPLSPNPNPDPVEPEALPDLEMPEEVLEVETPESLPEPVVEAGAEAPDDWDIEDAKSSGGTLAGILEYAVPVFLQFIFLFIAFRWAGVEAAKMALLFIAVADRFVIFGVRWLFLDLLEFPITFHADTLLSFMVMIALVTTMTHAKRFPTALKVVIASKVAGIVAAYLFFLIYLNSFAPAG